MSIWWWIIVVGVMLLLPTAYAGIIGAPYAPTRLAPVRKAFQMIGLNADDVVVDFGVGDGKILVEATRQGARAYGYELSPILFMVAWIRSLFHPRVSIRYGNFYTQELPEATVIFAFLMPNNMGKIMALLGKKMPASAEYVMAYAFPFKDIAPTSVVREKNCAPLYVYEANAFRKNS